jgi:hypothetical protein
MCAHQDFLLASTGFSTAFLVIWMDVNTEHARNGRTNHTSAILLLRNRYLQLLLQDFNKDFRLISKNTESCRLNIVPQWAAKAAAAAPAAAAATLC